MSKDNLPLQVNPIRFAENGANLRGLVLLKKMERLRPSLMGDEGQVDVTLEFGVDSQKIRYLSGHIATILKLQCQRCMEHFGYELTSDFLFGIVTNEEKVSRLPTNYDPLIVKDNNLILQDMIEEEIIINLPIVPMHEEGSCKVRLPLVIAKDPESTIDTPKENPFKIIESLKVKPKE